MRALRHGGAPDRAELYGPAMPLFRRKKDPGPAPATVDEHAVITHLPLTGDDFGTTEEREAAHELEARIEEAVKPLGGEHDGDEFGGGEAVLYTYGPDADALFEAIQPPHRASA